MYASTRCFESSGSAATEGMCCTPGSVVIAWLTPSGTNASAAGVALAPLGRQRSSNGSKPRQQDGVRTRREREDLEIMTISPEPAHLVKPEEHHSRFLRMVIPDAMALLL